MAVPSLAPALPAPPPVDAQLERLRSLGIEVDLGTLDLHDGPPSGSLVALAPGVVPVHTLAALLTHRGRRGFVVEDMTDVEEFLPRVEVPDAPAYLVAGLDRGDDLVDWRPSEALPEITARGRSPLTLQEGISWLLQVPEALVDNRCFMTIGSRRATPRGHDARTPAVWISRGTGRDGAERRHAPKVGWCWWNIKHTWLGFASCASRDLNS